MFMKPKTKRNKDRKTVFQRTTYQGREVGQRQFKRMVKDGRALLAKKDPTAPTASQREAILALGGVVSK